MTAVLIRRKSGHREDSQEKMGAEAGVMLPQTKEHVGLPEARGGNTDPPLRPLREQEPANTLSSDF